MRRFNFSTALLILIMHIVGTFTVSLQSQVTIGSGIEPIGGALLDLKEQQQDDGSANSTKGMILPRVELSYLNKLYPMFTGAYNIAEDAKHTGLTVYNLTQCDGKFARGVYTWTGTEWVQLTNNPTMTTVNPTLTFPQSLTDDNYLVRIPSGQDLRAEWTAAYKPAISFVETNQVTGASTNAYGGGLRFTSHALAPSFPATWMTSPINDISIWPDAMTASDLTSNPWFTRESKLTITGIAGTGTGTGPCPGKDQSQVITLNQTNYAIVPGSVASPTSLLVLRATTQQGLSILSNVEWSAVASVGTVPYADILSSYHRLDRR